MGNNKGQRRNQTVNRWTIKVSSMKSWFFLKLNKIDVKKKAYPDIKKKMRGLSNIRMKELVLL